MLWVQRKEGRIGFIVANYYNHYRRRYRRHHHHHHHSLLPINIVLFILTANFTRQHTPNRFVHLNIILSDMWSFSPASVHGLNWKVMKWISSTLFASGARCYTDISCIWTRFFTVPPLPADVDLTGGTGVELGAMQPWGADCLGGGGGSGMDGLLATVV